MLKYAINKWWSFVVFFFFKPLTNFVFSLLTFFIPLHCIRPISLGGKRSVFLTNTVALAKQQAECIAKSTALKVAVYTGDLDVDNWGREKWFTEFDDNQVYICLNSIHLSNIWHNFVVFLFLFIEILCRWSLQHVK